MGSIRAMATLALLGGVGEIGGNKVLLQEGDTALLLDFGVSYARRGRFYEEYLNPRAAFGLLDPLAMGLLPPLEGLYREDMHPGHCPEELWERFRGAPGYQNLREVQVAAVLCSHAHMDHCGYISFVREDVPIACTLMSAVIMKAIQDTGRTDFESEIVYAVPKEVDPDTGLLSTGNYKKVAARQRPFMVFASSLTEGVELKPFWTRIPSSRPLASAPLRPISEMPLPLGPFRVRWFPVDHSILGAAGFVVEVGGVHVAYTGDLRLHGTNGRRSLEFARALRDFRPLVLLCEGTRAGREEEAVSEAEVAERVEAHLKEARGLVIADFGPRHLERLQIFYRAARAAGRQLVIKAEDAYLLDAARLADPSLPAIGSGLDVLVYYQPKASQGSWEKEVYERHASILISPEEVGRRQDELVLCFSFFDLKDLPSIRPRPDSLYLYSSHEAFDEESRLDFRRLRNWLEHFGMRYVGLPVEECGWKVPEDQRGLHASGHASAKDLIRFIEEADPDCVVPIHTENPGWFQEQLKGTGIRVMVPEPGQPWRWELEALIRGASDGPC